MVRSPHTALHHRSEVYSSLTMITVLVKNIGWEYQVRIEAGNE